MAPIVSPKLLTQILMHGYPAVLTEPKLLPLLPLKSAACSSASVHFQKAIVATPSPEAIISAPASSAKAALASLPNCTFIKKNQGSVNHSIPASDMHAVPAFASSVACLTCDSLSEVRVGTISTTHSTVCSETLSSNPSSRSCSSINSPSTGETSIPPWCLPRPVIDTTQLAIPRASVPRYVRTRPPPVDSLRITRKRRASEAADMSSGSMFISRPRKKSDAKGLKGLGLRILKRVKW
ncbi:hypothetical protein FRC09_000832 [Ceratobasidium sp. 395]|nr:hypothetical protein FRC09_000832 [Ceratobasidium sp. 395]